MALSFSRPDPSSPASIADATFSTARRGFDQREVRDVLREVAAELSRLIERERFLQHELRTAQETTVDPADALDEETVSRVLGEETLRVLQTARESSAQIKSRAEESAARVIREASDEANRIRNEADADAARIRSDASADAEAELSLAKQQGREMVDEARAYRERVLSELGRRREAARQQIEQLVSGRDRLLQVFERARLVSVDVMSDLAPLDELDEYVDLSPITDPIPIMVPAGDSSFPPGSDTEVDPDTDTGTGTGTGTGTDTDTDTEVDPETDTESVDTEPDAVESDSETVDPESVEAVDPESVEAVEPESVGPESVEAVEPESVEPESVEAVEPESVEPEAGAEGGDSNVVALFGQRDADPADSDPAGGLFARLRAETAAGHADVASDDETVAGTESPTEPEIDAEIASDVAAEAEETVFQRRDADLVPLILAAARKLKRVLADEQNEALDTLRGKAVVRQLDDLVPIAEDHVERFVAAMTDELVAAARAGALLLDPDGHAEIDETVLGPVRELIADGLVQPLRSRLERAVADGGGENDQVVKKVRAVYREWKTTHIDDQLDDVLRLAHGVGAAAALTPGTPMCWSVDPDGPACPDAEDNALAGAVAAGEPYPTGHRLAPAHPGCRCLIVPTGN